MPALVAAMTEATAASVEQATQAGAAHQSSAEMAAATIADAATRLEAQSTALASVIDKQAQAGEILREDTENLRATERRLGSLAVLVGQAVTRGTALTEAALRQLPNTASQLRDGLAALKSDSQSMELATQRLTAESKAVAARLEHVTQQMATFLVDPPAKMLAADPAPDPAASEVRQEVARLSQTLRDGRDALDGAAQRLTQACGTLDGAILMSRGAGEATIAVIESASQPWRDRQQTLERLALEAPNVGPTPTLPDGDSWRGTWEAPPAGEPCNAVTRAADQVFLACEALNSAAHNTRVTNELAATQLDGLSRLVGQTEAVTRLLPPVLSQVGQAAATLQVIRMTLDDTTTATPVWRATDDARPDPWLSRLAQLEDRISALICQIDTSCQRPDSAESADHTAIAEPWRYEIATAMHAMSGWLDQLGTVAQRLEQASGAVTCAAEMARPERDEVRSFLMRMEASNAQMGGASQQLQGVVSRQDAAAHALEAASHTVQQMTARDPNLPADLAITLRQLTAVQFEAHSLLRQSEAVAEAVLTGEAPELRTMLASRIPALLSQLEATMQHLRSTATALALASDGPDLRRAA